MLEILSKALLYSSKFSRSESKATEESKIITKNTGNKVIKDKD